MQRGEAAGPRSHSQCVAERGFEPDTASGGHTLQMRLLEAQSPRLDRLPHVLGVFVTLLPQCGRVWVHPDHPAPLVEGGCGEVCLNSGDSAGKPSAGCSPLSSPSVDPARGMGCAEAGLLGQRRPRECGAALARERSGACGSLATGAVSQPRQALSVGSTDRCQREGSPREPRGCPAGSALVLLWAGGRLVKGEAAHSGA